MISASDRLGKLIKWLFILVIFSVVALAVVPLNLYYDYVKKHLNPLQLTGISGSVVKGSADSLKYMSAPLGKAEWLLYPKSHQSLGGKLRVENTDYDLTFDLQKFSTETQAFNRVSGFLNWSMIKPFIHLRYGELDGYTQVNLNKMVYHKSTGFEFLEGDLVLQDFKLKQPTLKDLGTVTLKFKTEKPGIIVGTFSSQSQVLNVTGSLYVHPHRWQLNLDIIPKAGHYKLDAVFNSVGDPRRGGGRRLNLAGFY